MPALADTSLRVASMHLGSSSNRRSIGPDVVAGNSRWYFDNSDREVGGEAGRKPRKAAVARGSLSIIFSTAQREINVG